MKVGEACTRDVATVEPATPLVEAARRMRDDHIGSLVVVKPTGHGNRPVALLTDRDIVVGVVATDSQDLERLDVEDVTTAELVTATEEEDLHTVLRRMRAFAVRRVPVVDDVGDLVGILSLDDVIDAMASDMLAIASLVGEQRELERERRPTPAE